MIERMQERMLIFEHFMMSLIGLSRGPMRYCSAPSEANLVARDALNATGPI